MTTSPGQLRVVPMPTAPIEPNTLFSFVLKVLPCEMSPTPYGHADVPVATVFVVTAEKLKPTPVEIGCGPPEAVKIQVPPE